MSGVFPRWRGAIDAASDDTARRTLLGEIGQWRAAHLIDVVGQREAAWSMARLYQALGDKDAAIREARSAVSLCRTPPAAEGAERHEAEALLARLTGTKAPKRKKARAEKPARGKEAAPLSAAQRAVLAGRAGNWSEGFSVLKGKGGPAAAVVRIWLDLSRAMNEEGEARDKRLNTLLQRLERELPDVPDTAAPAATPARPAAPAAPPTTRAGKLVGHALPDRRDKRLRVLTRFVEVHPEQADAVAEAALLDHLDEAGPEVPAPWLVGYVVRARVDASPKTDAALETLAAAGSVVVGNYEETPFAVVTGLWGAARGRGVGLVDVRRGVQRSEPDERRIWTLRLGNRKENVLVAVAPDVAEPYAEEGQAAEIAQRLVGLNERTVLVAPGDGNRALREAATALGLKVADADAALEATVDLLGTVPAPKPAPAPRPEAPKAPPVDSHKARVQAVIEALHADEVPTAEALEPLVAPIKRVRDLFDAADALTGDDVEARRVALLLALHRTAPEHVRLAQGTTLALHTAATSPDGPAATLLTEGEAASRFGGPGAEIVVPVAVAAQQAGWKVDRVLRGVTRRERREVPALEILGPHLEALWRLLVDKDGTRGEVWIASELPLEGRAAVPQLLGQDRPRVAVLEPTVADGWEGLGGPAAVAWTGDASPVVEVLGGWGG